MTTLVREGHVSRHVGDEATEVGLGQISAITAGHPWRGVAVKDSAIGLSLGAPLVSGSLALSPRSARAAPHGCSTSDRRAVTPTTFAVRRGVA